MSPAELRAMVRESFDLKSRFGHREERAGVLRSSPRVDRNLADLSSKMGRLHDALHAQSRPSPTPEPPASHVLQHVEQIASLEAMVRDQKLCNGVPVLLEPGNFLRIVRGRAVNGDEQKARSRDTHLPEVDLALKSHLLAARSEPAASEVNCVFWRSGLERGEMSKDILPFPLSAYPTTSVISLSMEIGRAQLGQATSGGGAPEGIW